MGFLLGLGVRMVSSHPACSSPMPGHRFVDQDGALSNRIGGYFQATGSQIVFSSVNRLLSMNGEPAWLADPRPALQAQQSKTPQGRLQQDNCPFYLIFS
jgi:hypothetical protein